MKYCISKNKSEVSELMQWMVAIILVFYPVAMLTSRLANDACFFLLIIFGLYVISTKKEACWKGFLDFFSSYWMLFLAFFSLFFVQLINQIFISNFRFRYYDAPIRFLFYPIILYGLTALSSKKIRLTQYGFVIAAFFSALIVFFATENGAVRPIHIAYKQMPLIPYTGVCVLMGVLSTLTINWGEKNHKVVVFLKILSFFVTLYGSYVSASRGVWIAIPVFIVLLLLPFRKGFNKKWTVFLISVFIVGLGFCLFSNIVQSRLDNAKSDIDNFLNGNKSTSIGIRFDLYKAAILMSKENIVLGIGEENYSPEMKNLARKGVISKEAAVFGHVHNEVLQQLLVLGVSGVISILFLYLVPFYYFFRGRSTEYNDINTAAYMGIILLLAFMIYGLTEVLIIRQDFVNFFVVINAFVSAYIFRRRYELDTPRHGRHFPAMI